MAVWGLDDGGLRWIGGSAPSAEASVDEAQLASLRQALERAPTRPGLHLFGLDGGLKASRSRADQLQELIDAVDSMPMRVREVRRHTAQSEKAAASFQADAQQRDPRAAPWHPRRDAWRRGAGGQAMVGRAHPIRRRPRESFAEAGHRHSTRVAALRSRPARGEPQGHGGSGPTLCGASNGDLAPDRSIPFSRSVSCEARPSAERPAAVPHAPPVIGWALAHHGRNSGVTL